LLAVWVPGEVLVVVLASVKAVVELSEQLVRQSAQRRVVVVAGIAAGVVVGACAGALGQAAEGPQVAGVGQTLVADVAGQDGAAATGGAGDGAGAGVVAAAGSIGEAGAVIAELAEQPGAEDETESGRLSTISASGWCSKDGSRACCRSRSLIGAA
jgi:uncharacterized membrane protein